MVLSIFSVDNIIVAVFVLTVFVQLYVYLRYFLPFSLYQAVGVLKEKQPFVSVIIASKNEAENLQRNLPLILNQDYPDFEVIVVDDHSTDETASFLQSVSHSKLQLHRLYDESGKKAAIQKGIEKAQYDRLIFIDADCRPKTTYWLRLMSEKLIDKKSIVLGYAPYYIEKTILNKLIRFETFVTAVQYFSAALIGKPYMGVGRNLAYTKAVYKESTAFQKHGDIISGDDDLLVNEMSRKSSVAICTQMEAHSISKATETWKGYFYQKRRHLQAGTRYLRNDRFRLAIYGIAQLLFWITFFFLLFSNLVNPFILSIFVLKLMFQFLLYGNIMRKLGERDLLWAIPFLEIIHLVTISFIGASTWVKKVDRWK